MSRELSNESADRSQSFLNSGANKIFALAVAVLILMYAFVLVAAPHKLFADDSYFYLQVAWNFARGMGSTFNNIMPTNGYHPIWMLICAAVFKVFPDRRQAIYGIAWVIALFQVLTLLTIRRILLRVANDLWIIAFTLLLPYCFQSQLGTEGALSGMCLALVMFYGYCLVESPALPMALAFNFAAAFAVLSRLDNIFIIGFVWIAVWLALGRSDTQRTQPGNMPSGRRLQIMSLPIYIVLWGTYLATNYVNFGIIQPISGMLKSNSRVDHALGANLPHTAQLPLAIIFICIPILALKKRDIFFRAIEFPFALGVVTHALYIALRMSSETRWSWYYTSWMLLASVLLARVASLLLQSRRWLTVPVAGFCVLVLAAGWVAVSYKKIYRSPDYCPQASFNDAVYNRAGIHRAFAYDQPGILAYYSDIQIIPLDGLMGDVQFQHDLASKGIQQIAEAKKIDGFIGPPVPVKKHEYDEFCIQIFISTEQFHCLPDGKGTWSLTGLDVFARVPAAPAGTLPLRDDQIIKQPLDWIDIWKFDEATKTLARTN